MSGRDEAHDRSENPCRPRKLRARDPLHDLQLLRDLQIINELTECELGPMPPGGLLVEPKRKPNLPLMATQAPALADHEDEENDMNLSQIAATAVLVAAGATGCSPSILFGGKATPDYKQNPNPKQRYDITMVIAHAPGPFASVEGSVSYDIQGEACLPPRTSFIGAQTAQTRASFPVSYTQVDDNTYVGTIYVDQMLDADYYGNGVCQWRLTATSVHLKATGAAGETKFTPHLMADAVLAEQAETTYFWKGGYPRHPESILENPVSFGQTDRSKVSASLADDDLFAITLIPSAVVP